MGLSKAFDCGNYGFLLEKFCAYGLNFDALQLTRSYLTSRKQRVKINCSYSKWEEIEIGVLQGSVLRPLLNNIPINDIFWFADHAESL